eukprot:scaffold23868_cov18-Tisochrysis_lutea.AAC.1
MQQRKICGRNAAAGTHGFVSGTEVYLQQGFCSRDLWISLHAQILALLAHAVSTLLAWVSASLRHWEPALIVPCSSESLGTNAAIAAINIFTSALKDLVLFVLEGPITSFNRPLTLYLQVRFSSKSFGRDAATVAAKALTNVSKTISIADISDIIAGCPLPTLPTSAMALLSAVLLALQPCKYNAWCTADLQSHAKVALGAKLIMGLLLGLT